ncbi:hypothetical protein PDJ82_04025 [Bacillus cereus group sp. TH43LC]|uniref:Uncharacterized protein n=1 Tax=Bacillus cereus (strain ZK / E33L) TaxID=288681 RepID=Q634E0_BACCZ|nr:MULTISPECIES: hypothetical protein [Bacillus]AAU16122.1 hypothetical protein BCE33L4148 [Bacillus cereus E33L]AJI26726.1 hypothetical protein BF28_1272 [Bacillus cereus E33L]MCU4785527.1 hypothetical protein [Bacillus cereus]MCU5551385.1 hypothetical protein [Bacillus cereus]MDA1500763.1 hypothetical protein [Bacillus cereus group sp. TH43LC]
MYALLPIEEMAAQVVLHVMLEILVIGVGIVSLYYLKHHMLASGLAHCYKSNTNVYFESIAFSFMYNSLINMEQ